MVNSLVRERGEGGDCFPFQNRPGRDTRFKMKFCGQQMVMSRGFMR
jgi:hypothetical protein